MLPTSGVGGVKQDTFHISSGVWFGVGSARDEDATLLDVGPPTASEALGESDGAVFDDLRAFLAAGFTFAAFDVDTPDWVLPSDDISAAVALPLVLRVRGIAGALPLPLPFDITSSVWVAGGDGFPGAAGSSPTT